MEFKGMKNLSELVELVKQSEYNEDSDDILLNQFIDNSNIVSIDTQPYVDNDGIGYYEYGSEVGYDAGKDYLVLEGNGIITTTIDIEPLLFATDSPHLSKNPEDLKQAVNKFFLADDVRADTEFIIGEIMGNDGKPDLDESFSEMYDEQKMKLVVNDITISQSNDSEIELTISISWK
jgi:hypothetical protein